MKRHDQMYAQCMNRLVSRRHLLMMACAAPVAACAPQAPVVPEERDWTPYFADMSRGGILVDIGARRLAFWARDDAAYREYPIGVPSAPELERRGRTSVVRKVVGPTWAPTSSMLARNPDLPRFVPAGPDNPMGAYAMYLGWQYYAIHGTNDPATVGRRTTSGCIRLLAGHIEELYRLTPVGTPVTVI